MNTRRYSCIVGQTITYEEELWAKLQRVNDALSKIGGLAARVDEVLRTGQTEGYRNKAVFHSDGNALGFYGAKTHAAVAVDSCLLLRDDINEAIKRVPQNGEIVLRSGWNEAAGSLEEELDGLVFSISGFFQTNAGAALLLFQKAREYAAMAKSETLIDLYCGVGSLTLFVGRDAGYALGVEADPSAVEAARGNAKRNGLPHMEFVCADVAKWDVAQWDAEGWHAIGGAEYGTAKRNADCGDTAERGTSKTGATERDALARKPDCVIVDPPRKGLSPGAARKILELYPRRIVYVSCDPATLARDLRVLEGYAVKEVCAVDMFPRTANVECCCLLLQRESLE
jgi:tRNA/tmRNA/rRNA uracil-C5-methylase (TrmA/RlmC/RlmD family)